MLVLGFIDSYMRWWWNWYTRTLEVRMPQGVGVRVSPSALRWAVSSVG